MKYRRLNPDGDYDFGQGLSNFHTDNTDTIAQAVATRLRLWLAEWFLDQTDGTPYSNQMLGKYTQQAYDAAIQARILGTQGVTGIAFYQSSRDGQNRRLTIQAIIDTVYGQTQIQEAL